MNARSVVVTSALLILPALADAGTRRFVTSERLTLGTGQNNTASLSIDDLDGDGDPDVAVANGRHWPQQNLLLFNQGRSRFNLVRPLGQDMAASYSTAIGDLDGDGDQDIAVGNDMAPNLVFLNDGKGHFREAGEFGEPASIRSLALADIDDDGDIDLLANVRGRQNLIHLNDGHGNFKSSRPFGMASDSTICTAIADLDGDGFPDLILANRDRQQNVVLLNDRKGGFEKRLPFGSGHDETRSVAVADFNGDGRVDWVTGNIGRSNEVYLGDGKGGSDRTIRFGAAHGRSYSVAAADMDRDGIPDVVVGNVGQSNMVFFNEGKGTNFSAIPFGDPSHITYHVATGDLNEDGYPDIAVANSGAQNLVYLNLPNRGAVPSMESRTTKSPPPAKRMPGAITSSQNWPAFRGNQGRGVADGYPLRTRWNADRKAGEVTGVHWRTGIPGLGHSSPVIWGNRLFVCTAVPESGAAALSLGAGGRPTAAADEGTHRWLVLCFDKRSGKELWRRVAHEGKPRTTRHVKATQANSSVAVDGRHVVAFFGSEGLHCFDLDGRLLWTRDLGVVDISKYGIGWGYASSPVIHGDRIALVCDDPKNPFVTVLRLHDGRELWRVSRRKVSERSWGTPLILQGNDRVQVVVNGWPVVMSYDLKNGEELWRITDGGDNPIPTPFLADGHIYVASAHGPKSPIYVIRPGARGDITPTRDAPSNNGVIWSVMKGGSYMSTPVVYRGQIYLGTHSIMRSFNSRTGEPIFTERLPKGASIIASLVAGDGKIYCASENGSVYVLKAGEDLDLLATNALGEPCLASPAISEGILYFRTTKSLIAIK